MRILVMHGPNLNLLGTREPDVYGTATLDDINDKIGLHAASLGISVAFFQSNHEGAIIDRIQAARIGETGERSDALIINPGAFTHYSYAIRDAITAVALPAVEVHLSDIHSREPFRRVSVIAEVCLAQITGMGSDGYLRALDLLAGRNNEQST